MWTFRTASPFSNVFSLTNLYSPTALAKIPASVPPLELIPPSSHLVLDGYRLQSDPRTGSSIVDTSHLRTNSVRQEIVPALAPYTRFAPQVAATSSTITRDPDETKQVTNLGLGILSTLQIADPQSFGDIKASELSATIDALRTANITQLISDSPFVQMTENAVGPPASLAHYLKLDQLQTVDYGQMAYVLQLGVKVGAFAALNVASWYGSGFLQKIIQNVINSSELSEGKKHFLTQSAKATRITFVAMAAF
ncbi:MAG TPA: hypothetical protein VJC18_06470, partial [bacterium]|nr:hypothetical protein [bacterium]